MGNAWPSTISGIAVKRAPLGANRSDRNSTAKTLGIFHDIEGSAGSARNFFATDAPKDPGGGSTQFIADPANNCFWQLSGCDEVAYGCGNYDHNRRAVQCEFPGYAGRPYAADVLDYAARWAAAMSKEFGIPLDLLTREQLVANPNVRGFCGHQDIPDPNDPSKGGGNDHHQDPGPTFNMGAVLQKARTYAGFPPLSPATGTGPKRDRPRQPGQSGTDAGHLWPSGYRVGGGFYGYWSTLGGAIPANGNSNIASAIAIFGYPVSRVFTDTATEPQLEVQYFERARLELWPDGVRITAGLLGSEQLAERAQFLPAIVVEKEG